MVDITGASAVAVAEQQIPGCYLLSGNGDGAGNCEVHHPGYDFNDQILALGATFWVRLAQRFLD